MLRKRNILKKNLYMLFSLFILFFLSGCVTAGKKQNDYENQILRNRISFLETKIADLTSLLKKEKEEKEDLQETLSKQRQRIENLTRDLEGGKRERVFPESKSKAYYSFVIRIQTALKNAGFNPGLIDGKMGMLTRAALRDFQKANGLPENGQVDKQTWALLRKYL